MSICTLLTLFVTALVWPKSVSEKSRSSSHLAEYRGIPPLRSSKIVVHEKETTSLPLLLRASARKPCVTYVEIGLCFLSLLPPNPAYENPMHTVKHESLGVNKDFVSDMLAWVFICSLFPVLIFGYSNYFLKDTFKSVLFDS